MKKQIGLLSLFSLLLTIIGCSNDDNETATAEVEVNNLTGYIQKGPFLNGTTVNLSELDGELNQSGLTFSTQVTDNSGNFTYDGMQLGFPVVLLTANGFYYDEVQGKNSDATLTLNALADVQNKTQINVNVLTHLQKTRIEKLVDEGIPFQQATDSVQKELLLNFGITNSNISESDQLNMFVDSEDNAILIALSIIIQGHKSVSDFSEFLANVNLDFSEDGVIQNESLKAELYRSAQNLDLEDVESNLKERYESLGFNSAVPDFKKIVKYFLDLKAPYEYESIVEHLSCHGADDGKIEIILEGGTAPFEFKWSNGTSSDSIDSLARGFYWVEVTDALGNRFIISNIEIKAPDELKTSSQITNITDQTTGAIDLTVSGGTEPYSFEWSNDQSTEDISDLEKGIYTVTVTDANGCLLEEEITVQEEIELSFDLTNIPCFSESTGSIDLTVEGGLAPYEFEWSNNLTSEDIDNLEAGTYSVTVTDQLGFTITEEVELGQKPEILIDYQITRPTPGNSDGAIDVSVDGGLPPYQFEWSNNASSSRIDNISSGEYRVTVTDANLCSKEVRIPLHGQYTDSRDGKTYKTVQVGSQTWFAENLKSRTDNQGNVLDYRCITNPNATCEEIGYAYTFEDSANACPLGWRMPVENDWQQLERFLGIPQSEVELMHADRGEGVASRLVLGGDTLLDIELVGAILGPYADGDGSQFIGEDAIFWMNTTVNGTNAIVRSVRIDEDGEYVIYRTNIETNHFANCIRCIKE